MPLWNVYKGYSLDSQYLEVKQMRTNNPILPALFVLGLVATPFIMMPEAHESLKEGFIVLGVGIAALMLYLLPLIIAGCRRHRNVGAVAVLNVLLGWTFLGWVIALVWACMATQHEPAPQRWQS
jgi:hypothetical protein